VAGINLPRGWRITTPWMLIVLELFADFADGGLSVAERSSDWAADSTR